MRVGTGVHLGMICKLDSDSVHLVAESPLPGSNPLEQTLVDSSDQV